MTFSRPLLNINVVAHSSTVCSFGLLSFGRDPGRRERKGVSSACILPPVFCADFPEVLNRVLRKLPPESLACRSRTRGPNTKSA